MADAVPGGKTARFGPYHLDLRTGELKKDGSRVRLQEKPFQILAALLERPGEMVGREELHRRLWPADTFVDFEHSLNNALNRLRVVLNDSADAPRFIETIPRRGYRFLAAVELEDARAPASDPSRAAIVASVTPVVRRMRSAPRWQALAAVALLLALGVVAWQRRPRSGRPPPGRVMLAVLPFENLSGDPEQEYISDGLTEEMISRLGRLDHARMGVIARTSAMTYKGNKKPVDQIGRELHVNYVLEGSLRRSGDQLRITAQLIRTSDQTHLWAQDFDRALTDVVRVQSEIAGAIAQQVRLQITPEQLGRTSEQLPVVPEAYALHLRGRHYWNRRTPEALRKGLAAYQRAIELDPAFAVAYAGLADSYNSLGSYSVLPGPEAYPKAKAAAQKALELNPSLAQAHNSLAFVHEMYEWDWEAAEKEYRRALELDPGDANTLHWYSAFLLEMGRFQESLDLMLRAYRSDPLSLKVGMDLASPLLLAGRTAEAFEQLKKTLELDPSYAPAYAGMGWALEKTGRCQDAVLEFQKALDLSKENLVYRASLAHAFACAGKRKEAHAILSELLALSKRDYVSPHSIVTIYAALGEKDKAFEWLERAYRERDGWLVFVKVQYLLDPLRDDPRFSELLRKMNLQ